jgi:ABC-type Fe3+-hydroxamate transport system substrate-binding protein
MSRIITDQMGLEVLIPDRPQRIISVVPSQTELLFDLGLDREIVGVTRFCIHPGDRMGTKERIGGTKDFDIEKIKSLNPDLIIGNKEENYQQGIDELKQHFPVWMSDITTLDDACEMMAAIGEITKTTEKAQKIIHEIKTGFTQLSIVNSPLSIKKAAYFIWRKPYMVAAQGTFIDHMLGVLGVENVFADRSRYPEVTSEDIAVSNPDHIFLSSEPYSFTAKHIPEFQQICPNAQIHIVDGELFSWYGSRLKYTAAYFKKLRLMI